MSTFKLYLCVLGLLVVTVSAPAATLSVPGQYASIQAAIDAANPGDTVEVKAGEYTEALVMKSGVSLVGEGRDKVFVRFDGTQKPAITIKNCKDSVVQGITFEAILPPDFSSTMRESLPSVCLITASSAKLEDCAVAKGAARGIDVTDKSNVTIAACVATANYYTGIRLDGASQGLVERCRSADNECVIGIVGEGTEAELNAN